MTNNITDKELFDYIDSLNEKSKKRDSTMIESQCNKYLFSFEIIKQEVDKRLKKCDHYLDVCCGDGKKTILFGKTFFAKNIYGTDIALWGPYSNKKQFPFDFKLLSEKGELDYNDGMFDVITCFLSLHHIKEVEIMLQSIYKKLRKGGIFVVIEHDILNEMDTMIVDIQHMFYGYFYDKNKDSMNHPYYAKYYNRMEWSYMIQKVGFTLFHNDNVYENVSMTKRYDNQFYSVFVK
jgi:ubiquinone/menaquinone biosynthesis C-methylase UbiE